MVKGRTLSLSHLSTILQKISNAIVSFCYDRAMEDIVRGSTARNGGRFVHIVSYEISEVRVGEHSICIIFLHFATKKTMKNCVMCCCV